MKLQIMEHNDEISSTGRLKSRSNLSSWQGLGARRRIVNSQANSKSRVPDKSTSTISNEYSMNVSYLTKLSPENLKQKLENLNIDSEKLLAEYRVILFSHLLRTQ